MRISNWIKGALAGLMLMMSLLANAQGLAHKPGEILLRPAPGQSHRTLMAEFKTLRGKETGMRPVKLVSPQLNIWKWIFDASQVDENEMLSALRLSRSVDVAQFNHILQQRIIPNDPQLGSQWQWINLGAGGGKADADVDAGEAWDITTGGVTATGDTIVVAVIDDGTELDHPDLVDNIWVNRFEIPDNDIDDDNNGYVDDYYGWNSFGQDDDVDGGNHGVSVSGMIGAKGDNGKGVTGINWNVKIMSIVGGSGQEDEVLMSYSYALKQRQDYQSSNGTKGAFVVATNSSWGINFGQPEDAPLWCAFYDTLGKYGILSAGATANLDINIDEDGDLPTACPSEYLLSVTATNNQDERTFSGYGLEHIDVGAPGEDIFTTDAGGGYTSTSGTSFASPLTAGLIALLYSAPCSNIAALAKSDPAEAAKQIRDFIFQGVDKTDQLIAEIKYGGRVNARTSLDLLMAACGPCPPPNAIKILGLTDVGFNLFFTKSSSESTVDLRYRAIGATDWTEVLDINSPYKIEGLTACTEYEMQLRSVCEGQPGEWLKSILFKTDGCCENPLTFGISESDDSTVVLAWSKVLAAEGYVLRYKAETDPDWQTINTQNISYEIGQLLPCTRYFFAIRTICGDNSLSFSDSVSFKTKGCGACTDLAYCETFSDPFAEWIQNVQLGDINNTTGQEDDGYGDYTGSNSATVEQGASYPITLTPAYLDFLFLDRVFVYIDWNQNGTFEVPGEMVFTDTTTDQVQGIFTVPFTAKPGYTRMRVNIRSSFNPNDNDPCTQFNIGESEDYCIFVEVPICPQTAEATVSEITYTTAKISWASVEDALVYTFRYRKVGSADWTEIADTGKTTTLLDLEVCSDYEYQIQTVCLDDTSGYTASVIFQTSCNTSTENELAGLSGVKAYPNPFSRELYLDLQVTRNDAYTIDVYTMNGSLLRHLDAGRFAEGTHTVRVPDTHTFPPGLYLIKIASAQGAIMTKVIKQ